MYRISPQIFRETRWHAEAVGRRAGGSGFVAIDQVLVGAVAVDGGDDGPQRRREDALVDADAPLHGAVGPGGLDVGGRLASLPAPTACSL